MYNFSMKEKKLISVVVPMYNEGMAVRRFLDEKLLPVLLKLDYRTEVVVVDDGSTDRTLEAVRGSELMKKVSTRIIAFSRNFGKEIALSAGIREGKGDAVVMIDADGQHPAEAIAEMVRKWEEGAKVVTAVRKRNATKHKLGSRLFYFLMRRLGNREMVEGAMDFRLIDRSVAEEFNKFTERNRIARGLIDWLGFRQVYIKVELRGRMGGEPSYSFKKLMALAGDSFVSMSRTPLMLFGYVGVGIMVVSLLLGGFILVQQYILGDPLGLDWSGAVAMSVLVSFLVGLVLVSQAITALYVSQIHNEAKGRPLYVIDREKSVGLEDER